jgi:hypothetical protein
MKALSKRFLSQSTESNSKSLLRAIGIVLSLTGVLSVRNSIENSGSPISSDIGLKMYL